MSPEGQPPCLHVIEGCNRVAEKPKCPVSRYNEAQSRGGAIKFIKNVSIIKVSGQWWGHPGSRSKEQPKPDHRKGAGEGRLYTDSSHGYLRVTSC